MEEVLKRIEERWDHGAAYYNSFHVDNEDNAVWKVIIQDLLGLDYSKRVLDVGTGTGFVSLLEAELGYHTTGLDLSVGMLDHARLEAEKRGVKINFIKSCVEEIPYPESSFDVITNRSLMWTLTDPLKAVTEWNRILIKGGRLICFVHINVDKVHNNHYDQDIEESLPLKGADVLVFIELLKQAGFDNVKAVQLMNLPPMHGEIATEANCWYAFSGEK